MSSGYYAVSIISNESLAELIPALAARIISLSKIAGNLEYLDAVRGRAYDHLTGIEELIDDLECAYDIEEELKEIKALLASAVNECIMTLDIESEEPEYVPKNDSRGPSGEPVN